MKCPECVEAGVESTVTNRGTQKTMLGCRPFFDKDGKEHVHDRNRTLTDYTCSNGHRVHIVDHGSCWCGWKGKP